MDIGEIFKAVDMQSASGRVGASYYPYKDLKHTWRARDGKLVFRVSDYMSSSPEEVVGSLAWFLICRARGKGYPKELVSRYLTHVRSAEFWNSRRSLYVSRARSLSFRPRGSAHDLTAVFDHVNACYFRGEAERPDLAWVSGSPSRRVGFFHRPLRILAVNKALDSDRVPRFVLEFVVYHELLHGAMGCDDCLERRVYHTKKFRTREREFIRHDEAQKWLVRIANRSRIKSWPTEIVPQA